jgi:hypothetical protein
MPVDGRRPALGPHQRGVKVDHRNTLCNWNAVGQFPIVAEVTAYLPYWTRNLSQYQSEKRPFVA